MQIVIICIKLLQMFMGDEALQQSIINQFIRASYACVFPIVGLLFHASAGAADADEVEKLESQLQQQQQQLEKITRQLAQLKQQQSVVVQQVEVPAKVIDVSGFSFSSYGTVNYTSDQYFDNVQDTTPERRGRIDLERIVTEFGYQFNQYWDIEVEIEYEHGGTGAALEYDGFDEFGEFETEIEAGGEVLVEKAQIRYRPNQYFGIKLGNIHVPIGLGTILHKPNQYMTVMRHRSEEAMIPNTWNETGIGIFGQLDNFYYQGQVVSGLNSEYFRTYNWVAGGHQKRFEHVNADDLAFVARLDYGNFKQGTAIGMAYYYGNTSGNRHKTNKLNQNGAVNIFAAQAAYVDGPFIIRGQYLYGTLDHANAITNANKTTPGLRPGNFAQVGSDSMSFFVEGGIDLHHWFDLPLIVFANLDYSNPLYKVESGQASKRFENTWTSIGLNYKPIPQVVLKAEVGRQQVAVYEIPDTTFFGLGLGYQFSL